MVSKPISSPRWRPLLLVALLGLVACTGELTLPSDQGAGGDLGLRRDAGDLVVHDAPLPPDKGTPPLDKGTPPPLPDKGTPPPLPDKGTPPPPDKGTPPPPPDKGVPIPSCSDGIKNQKETDVDCSGPCPACANGKKCLSGLDCQSGWCDAPRGNICCQPGTTGCTKAVLSVVPTPWPQPSGNHYRYAPSAIEEGGYRYTFWCGNLTSGVVTDHIIVRRDQWNGSSWNVGSEKVALAPGGTGAWDHRHVCDPDIVRGHFQYQAPGESTKTTYAYALFYLGINAEQAAGGVNQVGWAVANNLLGPWKRVSISKPLITSTMWWGVGQPAVTSVDGKGTLMLFYTRGDAQGTRTLRRQVALANANQPVLSGELALPVDGLTLSSGAADPTNNGGAFVYDVGRDRFWLIRSGHPFPSSCPNFISTHLQVASIPGPSVWSGKGRWTVHTNLTTTLLGSARVFDGGFAKGPFGNLLAPNRLDLLASISQACVAGNFATALWSYRSHGVTMTP